MPDQPSRPHEPRPSPRPLPLAVATAVVVLQTTAVLGVGGWLLLGALGGEATNQDVADGSAAYFLFLGACMAVVATCLARRQGWSAGPALVAQLLSLPVAYYMLTEGFLLGAVPVGLAAAAGLYGLTSAQTREALGR